MPRAKKPPELRVVLDTNVLFSGTAHYLVTREISELITESSGHADLRVKCYLPETVIAERRYQMRKEGEKLLPHIGRLEKLLGHNLAITPDVLLDRVDAAIADQLDTLGIERLPLRVDRVDWSEMSRRSVERLAPFHDGEHEKGFRDALICEAFCQLVEDSPVTPDVCRVALVTGDERLREAAAERTSGSRNVRVLATTDELRGLVNTLVSAVSEEFVDKHRARATEYFFTKDDEGSLYYREGLRERITTEFGPALREVPPGASSRKNGTWFISRPEFVRKDKKRVTWSSVLEVECVAYRRTVDPTQQVTTIFPGVGDMIAGSTGKYFATSTTITPGLLGGTTLPVGSFGQALIGGEGGQYFVPPSEVVAAKGRTSFDVQWSVSIGADGVFRAPRIEAVQLVETTWDE